MDTFEEFVYDMNAVDLSLGVLMISINKNSVIGF